MPIIDDPELRRIVKAQSAADDMRAAREREISDARAQRAAQRTVDQAATRGVDLSHMFDTSGLDPETRERLSRIWQLGDIFLYASELGLARLAKDAERKADPQSK